MKIAIQTLSDSGHATRGIGAYTRNLVLNLQKIPGVELIEFSTINEVKDVDVIHYPYFNLFFHSLPIFKRRPTIITIHDVTPLLFPRNYPPGLKGLISHNIQKLSLLNVKAVITDSQSSKKDIVDHLKINPQKISVIYLGVDEKFKVIESQALVKIKKKYSLPEKFALFVGNVNWNKNILNLTKACLANGLDLVLIGAGFENKNNLKHPELKDYQTFLKEYSNNEKTHILGYIDDNDLVGIYNLANMTLLPSFYEGFGLPILESQACGTPVITSNLSSMPEVAGEGAIFVSPHNIDEITAAIKNLLYDRSLKGHLIRNGLENIKRFSWLECARQTYKLYEEIANN